MINLLAHAKGVLFAAAKVMEFREKHKKFCDTMLYLLVYLGKLPNFAARIRENNNIKKIQQ